jgi:SOS-response transcriptional repressor LexA
MLMPATDNKIFPTAQVRKSDFSYDAIWLHTCDKSDPMNSDPNDLYAALSRLRPDDMTEAKWTRAAGVSRSFFQDLKTKGTRPRIDTLKKMLDAIHVSMSEFNGILGIETHTAAPVSNVTEAPLAFRHRSNPMDVPVWGTAEGAFYLPELDGSDSSVETTTLMPQEIIDHIRRPIGIAEKKAVYALFVVGTSMEPRYLDGEPIFVDPNRTPAIGDHVVLQLAAPDGNGDEEVVRAMVKRLERRTANYYELRQYTPNILFRVPKERVSAIHRVIPPSELYGI